MLLVGMQISAATMEISMEALQKTKNKTTIWPSDTTLGHYAQELQSGYSRYFTHPYLLQQYLQ
jgi:hypothetical protein